MHYLLTIENKLYRAGCYISFQRSEKEFEYQGWYCLFLEYFREIPSPSRPYRTDPTSDLS